MTAKRIKIENASKQFKRQSQKREKKVIRCSVLIVCEGQKTEPNYFKAFSNKQQGVFVYDIELKGLGRGANSVVKKALSLKSKNSYDCVWAVFDKDDCSPKDFNAAITMCKNNGIGAAWSNEAFELWYLCHFQNVTTGISRKLYMDKISAAVNASTKYKSKEKYKYEKSDPDNYDIMTKYGSIEKAIQNAEIKHLEYTCANYAEQNPCTTVYKLVRQLLGKDMEFNEELIAKVNAE